jgi:hypothetical protein
VPTDLRWGPYRAFFYSNERMEPPHVHVRAGNREAKIWLADLTIATNVGFPPHEIGDILREVKAHREVLLDAWNEHFGNRGR